MEHTIDAKGKKLGRIASQAASLLMGKNLASFSRHKAPAVKVTITNVGKMSRTEAKTKEKRHIRFSGYPGSQKFESDEAVSTRLGLKEVVRRAVRGMIPNNKLRPDMLKRLHISE
jgi:large subunit ribosomal protein L13